MSHRPMHPKPSQTWLVSMLAAGSLAAGGCGSTNPPCDVNIATVEAARTAAESADARLAALQSQRDRLDAQIAANDSERAALEAKKAELEAAIAELEGE